MQPVDFFLVIPLPSIYLPFQSRQSALVNFAHVSWNLWSGKGVLAKVTWSKITLAPFSRKL